MCKLETSQRDESRVQSPDSLKTYRKPLAFNCISGQWLFSSCFLLVRFSKRGTMLLYKTYVCLCIQAISRFRLKIDKRLLNPNSHMYFVANAMSTAGAVSYSLWSITIAEHQYSSKLLLPNCISSARFECSSARSPFSIRSSDILSKLKECEFIIHFSEVFVFTTSNIYKITSTASEWATISSQTLGIKHEDSLSSNISSSDGKLE